MDTLETLGFVPLPVFSPFIAHNGPFWFRLTPQDRFEVAIRIGAQQTNALGNCHGGMLMTLVDAAMSGVVCYDAAPQKMSPSVSITSNFIRPALLGDTIIARANVDRNTSSLAFATCVVHATTDPDSAIMTAHGVYAIPSRPTPGFDMRTVMREAYIRATYATHTNVKHDAAEPTHTCAVPVPANLAEPAVGGDAGLTGDR